MTISHEAVRSAQSTTADEPLISLVGTDVYAVMSSRETLGFVHRVGNVYVALDGDNYARACEVGQSLSWDEAVLMVCRSRSR